MGILDNSKKGKSFILEKLSGYEVPQGFSIKTEGITIKCFYYLRNPNYYYIFDGWEILVNIFNFL